MFKKIITIYNFISKYFMWIFALIFGILKVAKPFITQKKTVDLMNSKPESRKGDIGVADNNGLKQVEAIPSNAPKSNEIPVGTIPESKTTISGEGTLKPINNGNQPGERSTEDVLKDLSEILNK